MKQITFCNVLTKSPSSSSFIINVLRHENAIPKGKHPLYHTEAVLDGSLLSKRHLVIWQFYLFLLAGCSSWHQPLIILIRYLPY